MVFAFLPTAVLMVVALLLVFLGGLAAALDPASMWMWSVIMVFNGAVCTLLAFRASDRLYKNSVLLCSVDFHKWYIDQRKIAATSFGGYKIAVMLNMLYVMCAYERFEEARRILNEAKPYIQASGNAFYKCCYIMHLIAVKEKTKDTANINELFSEAFQNLELAKIPRGISKKSYIFRYRYARLEYEFYRSRTEELAASLRALTEQLNETAVEGLSDIEGMRAAVGYEAIEYSYSIAVTDLILGKEEEAQRLFENIAACKCGFPLVKRVREYLLKKDILVLFYAMP